MAIVAAYNESDAYWTEEDVAYMQADDPRNKDLIPGYQQDLDEMYYDDFKWNVKEAFSKRKFPLVLVARKSNWMGQDGFSKCNDIDDVLSKVASFDGSFIELHRTRGGALHFNTASHDCPTGITIEVKPHNYTLDK